MYKNNVFSLMIRIIRIITNFRNYTVPNFFWAGISTALISGS